MSDFSRLLRPSGRKPIVLWVLSAILLAISCVLLWHTHLRYQRLELERVELAQLRSTALVPPIKKASREDEQKSKLWSALQTERNFRWYPVFRGLESASTDDIELLEFAPDKANKTFLLRGEARGLAALLRYLDALNRQEGFDEVFLSHQKKLNRGGLTVLAFEIKGKVQQ